MDKDLDKDNQDKSTRIGPAGPQEIPIDITEDKNILFELCYECYYR